MNASTFAGLTLTAVIVHVTTGPASISNRPRHRQGGGKRECPDTTHELRYERPALSETYIILRIYLTGIFTDQLGIEQACKLASLQYPRIQLASVHRTIGPSDPGPGERHELIVLHSHSVYLA